MASFILYSRLTLPATVKSTDYYLVKVGKREIFVRAELLQCGVVRAYDVAAPRDGEIVLNSIPAD